jgi:Uma2 family endonuclease
MSAFSERRHDILDIEVDVAMTTAAPKTVFTPEELLLLPDAVNYELVDGNLVERHMGSESSAIAMAIGIILGTFVKARRAGHLFTTDCGYQCFPNQPGKVRKPDISFVATGRLPAERVPQGYMTIAPDLAIEVLSPGDLAYEVDEKVAEYLAAGVKLIWIVSPKTRTVQIHRPASATRGAISVVAESGVIDGEDILPGFSSPVAEFFNI